MDKIIGIYFSDSEAMGYPFHKKEFFEAYGWLIDEIERNKNIVVKIVRGKSYLGKGIFENSFILKKGVVTEDKTNIKIDLIFNRDDKNTIPYINDCKIINHPDFDDLCVDKLKTFELFSEISPKTKLINSFTDYKKFIGENNFNKNDFIVLKKNFGTEGRDIYIGEITGVEELLYDAWEDILVQEYVDTSIGIEGIVEGKHDIRITVINGKPVMSFIRQPKQGSYLANVSQGGSSFALNLDKVPKELFELINIIDSKIGEYGITLYSADFINSKDGFKLVELNSRPGLLHPDWVDNYKDFNGAVAEMLINEVTKK